MTIFVADLGQRKVDFRIPGYPLSDKAWMATLDSVYGTGPNVPDPKQPTQD